MKEALYWEKKEGGRVACHLCPQECVIAPGRRGRCRMRENRDGTLYSLNYGRVAAAALDPIEKKPLYHFYPSAAILSLGTLGCNLACAFCQNWEIAHGDVPTRYLPPEEAVALAERERVHGNIGLAFTYNEPFIWYEYVLDTARMSQEKGLKNVLVTNGFVNPEPLEAILPYIDAMNIDVKAFREEYYHRLCGGKLEHVKRTVERAARSCHVEVTTLLVTDQNDSPEEVGELAAWLASIDPAIPLHLSRYFPAYKMDLPPTPVERLERAREEALKHLRYVYLGNVGADNDTFCPGCGALLVARRGYAVAITGIEKGTCRHCGRPVEFPV